MTGSAKKRQRLQPGRTRAPRHSLHRLVRRGNPKRLSELTETLRQLRGWTKIEAGLEANADRQKIWIEVRDWAVGAAIQHKINLDSGPVALKAHTGSAGLESPNGGAAVRSSDLLGFPPVIDVCCGSRMFWFDRKTPQAIFVDKRTENHVLCDGRKLEIAPDVQADFTDLPFPHATFYLVVFDPPHMTTLGANSWMAKKYGRLTGDWKPMLKAGFEECFRVLKPNGTLVFKWNETDVKLKEVLELSPIPPLFGHTTGRQAKTVWATFLKPNVPDQRPGAPKP